MAGVITGHKRGAGGGADGAAGVRLSEADAFGGHAIKVGRLDPFLTITAEIAVAEVIGHDENDVRRTLLWKQGVEELAAVL